MLMERGLWCGTVTLDARDEMGTESDPSVKRQTVNSGAFHGCYSFNENTQPGPNVHVIKCTERGMKKNPLVGDIVRAWRSRSRSD